MDRARQSLDDIKRLTRGTSIEPAETNMSGGDGNVAFDRNVAERVSLRFIKLQYTNNAIRLSVLPILKCVLRNILLISQMKREVTLCKMLGTLMMVWVAAWTPYMTISVWAMFFDASGLSPILGLIPTLCCKVSAGTNAMLYGLRYDKYLK